MPKYTTPWHAALRMSLAFVLAFSTTLGAQAAFAAGGSSASSASSSSSSSVEPKPDPKPEPEPEPEPAPVTHYVSDLSLYKHIDRIDASTVIEEVAYASAGLPSGHLVIDQRGGEINFDLAAYWDDGSVDYDWQFARFKVDDATLATIDETTGVLTAVGGKNGTVVVTAVLDKGYAEGAPLEVQVAVDLKGQESTPYVRGIEICDDHGNPIEPSYTFNEGLTTAVLELQAKVEVRDPATGADTTYLVTSKDGLSKQTGGKIADLAWSVVYDDRGSVSADGVYRPSVEGDNTVYARSDAGLDGTPVQDDAMIILEGAGHAQDHITIDAVWEMYPDKYAVKPVTLSVDDVREKCKIVTQSYTVYGQFGKKGFVTYTGRGALFADLLKAAGIEDADIIGARFDCWDTRGYEVSRDKIFGTNRYYFPDMDTNNKSTGIQVAPMLAIESARAPEGSSQPVPDGQLTNDDCFRLLFGVQMEDDGASGLNTRKDQRRWVNAIHLTFRGGPESENGDPEDNTITSPPEKPPASDNKVNPGESGLEGGPLGGEGTDPGAAAAGGGGSDAGRHNKGAWSILQAVNKNDSDTEALDFDNPLRPFTAPVCVGLFAAGGAEAFARFRWQKRTPEIQPAEEEA